MGGSGKKLLTLVGLKSNLRASAALAHNPSTDRC